MRPEGAVAAGIGNAAQKECILPLGVFRVSSQLRCRALGQEVAAATLSINLFAYVLISSCSKEDGTVSESVLESCTKGGAPSASPAKPEPSSGAGTQSQQTPVKAEVPSDMPDGVKSEGHRTESGSKGGMQPKQENKEDKEVQQQEMAALVSKVG